MKKQNSLTLTKSLQVFSFDPYDFCRLLPLIVCFISALVFDQTYITYSNRNDNLTNTFKFDFITPLFANSTNFNHSFTNQGATHNITRGFGVDILNAGGDALQSNKWKLAGFKWLSFKC